MEIYLKTKTNANVIRLNLVGWSFADSLVLLHVGWSICQFSAHGRTGLAPEKQVMIHATM